MPRLYFLRAASIKSDCYKCDRDENKLSVALFCIPAAIRESLPIQVRPFQRILHRYLPSNLTSPGARSQQLLSPSPLLSRSQSRRPRQRRKSTETAVLRVCRQKPICLLALPFTGRDLKGNLTSESRKLPGQVSAPSSSSSAFQAPAQPNRWQLFQPRYFPGLRERSEFRGVASPPRSGAGKRASSPNPPLRQLARSTRLGGRGND